jgi:uncharacterized protein YggE
MRRTWLVGTGLAGAFLLGAALPRIPTVAQDAATSTTHNTITVSADGTVQAKPDVAFVTVGVQQTNIDASKAQQETNSIATKALAGIKSLGIPDKDIQTSDLSLNPQYDDHNAITGFQASETFSIMVERLSQTGAVIDTAVRAGANQNVSVSFGLKDASQAQSAALKAAVAVAQRKARAVASQLGVSLSGAKIQVSENSSQPPVPLANAQRSAVGAPTQGTSTPIQTGTLIVQDSVTVTYTY